MPKKFNYQNVSQSYIESNYKEDVSQIMTMKKHPLIIAKEFYIHPSNIKK
jgi:hypothetical protein